MKHLLLIAVLFLITSSLGMAQSGKKIGRLEYGKPTLESNSFAGYNKDHQLAWKWKIDCDTIEIAEPLQIHYIKVGTEVYQIVPHGATIEKSVSLLRFYPQPFYTPYQGTFTPTNTPSGSGATDVTDSIKSIFK